MKNIKAIGFDLFNTLITADPDAVHDAVGRLKESLEDSGISPDGETFAKAYRRYAIFLPLPTSNRPFLKNVFHRTVP